MVGCKVHAQKMQQIVFWTRKECYRIISSKAITMPGIYVYMQDECCVYEEKKTLAHCVCIE